jgi:hypothetical protein
MFKHKKLNENVRAFLKEQKMSEEAPMYMYASEMVYSYYSV